jgi:hypothetical protein
MVISIKKNINYFESFEATGEKLLIYRFETRKKIFKVISFNSFESSAANKIHK